MPQNSFSLFLTSPDIGPIGLPGSVDPHADFNFDLQVHTNIIVPLASGQQLSATDSGGSSSNMRIVHENATASAVTVFNDVIKFFGGSGFLNGLTDNHTFPLNGGLGNFLEQFNSQLAKFPPGVTFMPSYDVSSGTLTLRASP